MNKYKAILFDYDGTLMDTNEAIVNSWKAVARKYMGDRDFDIRDLTIYFGRPLMEAIELTCEKYGIKDDPEEIAKVYRGYQADNQDKMMKLFPGIREMILELKKKGYLLGIVTSRVYSSTRAGLEHFGIFDCFDALVTCEDTDIHKPDPTPCIICCEKLGIDPKDAVMVGDSVHDLACGNRAGAASCFVEWSFCTDKKDISGDAIPTFSVKSAAELADLF